MPWCQKISSNIASFLHFDFYKIDMKSDEQAKNILSHRAEMFEVERQHVFLAACAPGF